MNRKQFLKRLGLLFGAAIVAPSVLAETKNKSGIIEIDKIKFTKFADDYAKRASELHKNNQPFFPDELINFANWFSNNYKTLSTTNVVKTPEKMLWIGSTLYYSEKGNFQIRYYDIIKDECGKTLTTPTRINRDTRVMEFSKVFFTETLGVTKNSVFYMVLWTWNILQCNNFLTKCDIETLQYYLQLGLPKKDVHLAWINTFKNSPSEQNKLRLQKIEEFINKQYLA